MCLLSVCIVRSIGRWAEFSAWIVVYVVLLYSVDDMVMSGDVGCCVVWHPGRGICVERYMIGVIECFGNQFTTAVICGCVPECVIIEFGMLVMYCMQFIMSEYLSVVSCCGVFLVLCIC